jgi:ABC-type transport system involved in multi-copper enzyme maturation permease subunit
LPTSQVSCYSIGLADDVHPETRAGGAVHDLGYQRYVGIRRPPSTRWRVVMRHQIATGWKTWWRYKAALGLAVGTTAVWGGLMFFLTNIPFRGLGGLGEAALSFSDATVPMSMEYFCRVGFFASMVIGATVIAGDVESGTFAFYFARSVRPRDYVLGKLAGFGVIVASLVVVGPVLLAALRIGMYDTQEDVLEHLVLVPKAFLIGAIAAVTYTAVPLGFSALAATRRNALMLWAAYYLVLGTVEQSIAFLSKGSIAAAFDLPSAIQIVAYELFDIHPIWGRRAHWGVPTGVAVASLFIHVTIAITITWYAVARAQKRGIG